MKYHVEMHCRVKILIADFLVVDRRTPYVSCAEASLVACILNMLYNLISSTRETDRIADDVHSSAMYLLLGCWWAAYTQARSAFGYRTNSRSVAVCSRYMERLHPAEVLYLALTSYITDTVNLSIT